MAASVVPDAGILLGATWAAATALVYGVVLRRRYKIWRKYRGFASVAARRSWQKLLVGLGLFIAAAISAMSAFLIIPRLGDPDLRRLMAGVAFGAFSAAGLILYTEDEE